MRLKFILPFPLPTWNRILAMNPWERKRLRDWIYRAVYICIHYGEGWPTRTVSAERLSLMGCDMRDYYQMIRPAKSKASLSRKKKRPARNLRSSKSKR